MKEVFGRLPSERPPTKGCLQMSVLNLTRVRGADRRRNSFRESRATEPRLSPRAHHVTEIPRHPRLLLRSSTARTTPFDERQLAIGVGIGGGSSLDSVYHNRQPSLLPVALEGARQQASACRDDTAAARGVNSRALFGSSPCLDGAAEIVVQAVICKLSDSLSSLSDASSSSVDMHISLFRALE